MIYLNLLGFVVGVGLRIFFLQNISFVFLVIFFIVAFLAFYLLEKSRLAILGVMFFCFLIVGYLLSDNSIVKAERSVFAGIDKQSISIEGVVMETPKIKESSKETKVKVLKLNGSQLAVPENILVKFSQYQDLKYGDQIKASGLIMKPGIFTNDFGKDFNYKKYLLSKNIYSVMMAYKIEKTGEGGNIIKKVLVKIKVSFIQNLGKVMPTRESSLMNGILLGVQDAVPQKTTDEFRNAGLSHVMVLSGYNITIVGETISKLFGIFCQKFIALSFGSLFIILFAILSEGGASAFRATIMSLIAISGRMLGREYNGVRILFVAGFIMAVFNPLIIFYDTSFHLTFLASLGMILFSEFFDKKLIFIKIKVIREIVATTTATQVFIFPYILWKMGSVSIVSLVTNALVLPVVPLTMLLGFITGLFGYFGTAISFIPGFASYLFVFYIEKIASIFGSLFFATIGF